MNERQAFAAFRLTLLDQLQRHGYTATQVVAGRQPTDVGRLDNAVYFFAIGEAKQTTQGRSYNPLLDDAGHAEAVQVSKTIQLQAFKRADPSSYDDTASDLCAFVHMILCGLPFTEAIRAKGLAISQVTPIREPEFINEHGQYEKNPSFDFDLGFERVLKPATPLVKDFKLTTIKGV